MPIKGLTDELRMPRLGKIHLGIKEKSQGGNEYPKATDYFVCPPEVLEALGETQPKELTIMFPTEEPDQFAPTFYKAFSRTRGLMCKGDGETAGRKVDMVSILGPDGVMPTVPNDAAHWPIAPRDTDAKNIKMHTIDCAGRDCPQYLAKACGRMMMLQFMLPGVPGLGIYQIDTGSRNGILNVYGGLELIRAVVGRVSMIPLTLKIGPMQTHSPDTGREQTNMVLTLTCDFSLDSMQAYQRLGASPDVNTRALPEPDDEVPTDLVPGGGTDDEQADATDIVQQPTEQARPMPAAVEQPETSEQRDAEEGAQSIQQPEPAPAQRKPRSDKKLSAADKESLLAEVRGTGMNKEEWQAAYKEMGLQDWANINEGDKAKILECLSIYAKAHETPPPAEPEEASPPDLGGEEEIATAGEVKDFELRAEAVGLTWPMRRDWFIMEGSSMIDVGNGMITKERLNKAHAWVAGFEDGSEDDAKPAAPDFSEEEQSNGEQVVEHEAADGEADSAAIAGQQEEKGSDATTGDLGGSAVPAEPGEASDLTLCRAYAEMELEIEYASDEEFCSRFLGMTWADFLRLDGSFNEGFKRRVGRAKDMALA